MRSQIILEKGAIVWQFVSFAVPLQPINVTIINNSIKMKSQKLMMTRVAMLLLVVFTSMGAWADESGSCGDGVTYTYVSDTNTLIISYSGSGSGAMADYTLPTLEDPGTPAPWYSYRGNIKTVVVGNGVTHIGDFSFYNCSAITTLNIPNSVTSIGYQAFQKCYSLICVTIGTGVTSIGYSAFEDCTQLATVVVFATSVPTLGNENVFGNNADWRSIYVPDGSWETYKSNWNAYSDDIDSFIETGDCGKTSSDNVKWVSSGTKMVVYGSGAMADYSSPGQGPWPHETAMRVIIIIEEGVTTIGNYAFAGHGKITHTVTIPNTVQTIGTNAFSNCSKIETLTIGSGVKTIGDHAFYYCSNITSLTLPDGVETIGDDAFYRCSNINSLTLPDGVETIGDGAFFECEKIPSVTIPSSVTRIGDYAFNGCSELATVTFSGPASSVTTIGEGAFNDCAKLESITIPSSVTSIGERVFGGCSKLTSISVESGNTVYDSGDGCNAIIKKSSHTLIAGCQNTTIPNTVTSIGNYAFDEVSGLTSIEIPSSVTSLGEGAFYDCDLLASITIPSSVTNIGDDVFYKCSALSTVVILPASLTTYGKRVFDYNKSDRKIYVPNGSLGTYQTNWSAYSSAIYGYTGTGDCGKTSGDNVNWVCADMDGNSTGETMVIYGSGAMADYTQPDQAPWYDYDFTTLNIEEGVTTIGNYAFQNCNGINTVNLPSKVTSIGNYAFDNAGLTSATLNSNPTIGNNAFGSGVALTMNLAASASNGYKWASFFNKYCNFQVDENTTVFKAKSNGEKVTLTAIADGIIPAGTAVVLRTPTDSSPVLTNTSSSTSGSYEDNELKGSSTAVTQDDAHTYYALAIKSGNVGLYKVKSSAKIPAGKAYLEDVIATTRDFLAFEDSEPTGIVDGRWKMEEGRGDGWYTLDGRKLNGKPKKKGMYVVNGNKVVIK
jgi:hypothetical protein